MSKTHKRCNLTAACKKEVVPVTFKGEKSIQLIVAEYEIHPDSTEEAATRPPGIRKNGTRYTCGLGLTKNICEVFGSDGYIKTAYTYTPYGSVTASGSVGQPIQWSSEYDDTELGLVYYNYRHYNPADGRWTQFDVMEFMDFISYAETMKTLSNK